MWTSPQPIGSSEELEVTERLRSSAPRLDLSPVSADGSQEPLQDAPGLFELRTAMAHLLQSIIWSQMEESERANERLTRAAELLKVDLSGIRLEATDEPIEKSARAVLCGGLAPWQVQRLKNYIEANLGSEPLQTKHLAALTGLTPSHFSRVFRVSFGESPHRFVMRRRIERAQGLMLQSDLPLSRIASDCGFSDQAHFNRMFRKRLGECPGIWRRARSIGPV
jgi:AraC family transcriptional regulator